MFSIFRRKAIDPNELTRAIREAAAILIDRALEIGSTENTLRITMYDCKLRGKAVGDWEFTVTRIKAS